MPDAEWSPWNDLHPDLTLNRLVLLASLFRKVWRRAAALHEPDEGDDMWSLSCRAFTRCGFRLKHATQEWAWLSVVERRKMQMVLCVGVAPLRFYHGEPDDVPSRYAAAPDSEKTLRQGLLDFGHGIRDGVLLRIAVTTDAKGVPLGVSLVEFEEATGETLNTFVIPEALAGTSTTIRAFPKHQPKPGVLLPKPSVRPRRTRVTENAETKK